MQIEGWKYYNHAMLPTSEPHEIPDMRPIESGAVWNAGGGYSFICKVDNRLGLRL